MKRTLLAIAFLCLLLLSACEKEEQNISSINISPVSFEERLLVESPNYSVDHSDNDEADNSISYEDIIDAASAMYNGLSDKRIISDDIEISSECQGMNRDYQELGYAATDINGDGIDELIFGVNPVPGNSDWKGYVYDIYTMVDNRVVQLVDGAARNHWFICSNNMLAYEISSDGFSIGWEYWAMSKDGDMMLKETVIKQNVLDENQKSKTLWLYSDQLDYTYHNNYELFDIITEEKAGEIKEKYKYVYLEFTPF